MLKCVDMDVSCCWSGLLEFGVVENCVLNEVFNLNGFGFAFDACAIRGEWLYMED